MTDTLVTASQEAKQFYDKLLLERAMPELVHNQWSQKRDLPKNGGISIEFRRFGALPTATTALTDGTAPGANSLTITTVTASVAQYGKKLIAVLKLFLRNHGKPKFAY